jgi:Kef-type K+ transport system membrane component KefB
VGAYLGSIWAGVEDKTEYMLVGAMPGRLSISVAAAEIGRRQGIIQDPLYYAFIILSILSVFVSVFIFRYVASD